MKFSQDVPSVPFLSSAKSIKWYVPLSLKATLTTSWADIQIWLDIYTGEYDILQQIEMRQYISTQEYKQLLARYYYEIL